MQSRIQVDGDKNVSLDQSRYALSMVERYIPNSPPVASLTDKKKYASPLPYDFKWSKADNSKSKKEMHKLEDEFGFRMIELAGSFNYLGYSALEELFAIRKLCRFTSSPGRKHFQAALHMLHHIRCHPPRPLKYYHKPHLSPLAQHLKEAGHPEVDPSFVWFSDSSFADAD